MTHAQSRKRLRDFVAASNALHRAHLDTPERREAYRDFVDLQLEYFLPMYGDLRDRPGYGPAIDFVISDLVGPGIADRDRELEKVVPVMSRFLPSGALAALATAMELNARILEINLGISEQLAPAIANGEHISERRYCLATREVATFEDFTALIGMTREAGMSLERIVAMPMITPLLKSMRGPARLAGVGDLQAFLEKGLATFRGVEDIHEFLELLEDRMETVFRRVFLEDVEALSGAPIAEAA